MFIKFKKRFNFESIFCVGFIKLALLLSPAIGYVEVLYKTSALATPTGIFSSTRIPFFLMFVNATQIFVMGFWLEFHNL